MTHLNVQNYFFDVKKIQKFVICENLYIQIKEKFSTFRVLNQENLK